MVQPKTTIKKSGPRPNSKQDSNNWKNTMLPPARSKKPIISKTRFVNGLQCPKRLYWEIHEPDAPELIPAPGLQHVFSRGHVVGDRAQEYFPGGVLIGFEPYERAKKAEATRNAIDQGASVIYEASFFVDNLFCSADILHRNSSGWTLTEVKSSLNVSDVYVHDVAIQTYMARLSGIDVNKMEVMVLNRDCRYPDLSNLFRQQDVTADVLSQQVGLSDKVNSFFKILDGDLPKINPGAHCNSPYRCPFVGRCCPQTPSNHISEFYRASESLKQQLESQNLSLISDIKPGSESFNKLSPIQQRQVTTLLSGTLYSDHVGLKNILDRFRGMKNLGFLDFETVMPAIPVWDGCSPFEQVPVQFSAIMCTNGSLDNPIHSDYFPSSGGDPRELEAQSLVAALRDADVIFAYSSSMEGRCIRHLQNAVPRYHDEL